MTKLFIEQPRLNRYTGSVKDTRVTVDDQTKNKSKKLQILADKILFLLKV